MEATPLQDKRAFTTAAWLYDAIIARWGRPLFIRCDRGGEFEGEFFEALRSMGIVRRRGTSGNKRVNGQSERGIRALRATIRKYMAEYPGAQWTDVLPYALIALRLTAQRAHGFPPFTIITGRVPILPATLPQEPPEDLGDDATPAQEAAYTDGLYSIVKEVMDTTSVRLQHSDRLLRAAIRRRDARATPVDTLFHFAPGDLVLRKSRQWARGGKLNPKGDGVWRVLEVKGLMGQRVKIERVPDETRPKRRRGEAPLEIHAALLAPLVTAEEPALIYDDHALGQDALERQDASEPEEDPPPVATRTRQKRARK